MHHLSQYCKTLLGALLVAGSFCRGETQATSSRSWSAWQRGLDAKIAAAAGPTANDVTMRTLEFRDVPETSPMNVFRALRQLHANRLEWTYIDFDARDRQNIERVKQAGHFFGGAGSASMHDRIQHFPPQQPQMNLLTLEGAMVVQPHMRQWQNPRGIGDVSNPDYYAYHLDYYKKILDWGADGLHRDEPEGPVFAAARYGGGFTPTGIAGFRQWLMQNAPVEALQKAGVSSLETFDYGDYLKARGAPSGDAFAQFECPLKDYWIRYWIDTNTDFWQRMVSELRAYAGERPFAMSCNNSSLQLWEPYHQTFDFAISELLLETANPVHLWQRAQRAALLGKTQVFGPPKTRGQQVRAEDKMLLIRKVFATAYACGMLAMLPWDVFDQSADGNSRYFIDAKDIADLSAFVRSSDWSGYEQVLAFGAGLPTDEAVTGGLHAEGGSGGVYGFVHVSPDAAQPIRIHLVDWGLPVGGPQQTSSFAAPGGERVKMYAAAENLERTPARPLTLVLPADAFDNPAQLRFQLLTPETYTALAHAEAAAKEDWQSLVRATPLTAQRTGNEIRLALPALAPWGIVEVVPAAE